MNSLTESAIHLLNSQREPLILLDASGNCVWVNDAFRQFVGADAGCVCGKSVNEFWPEFEALKGELGECSSEFCFGKDAVFAVKLHISTLPNGVAAIRVLAGISKGDLQRTFHTQRLETLGILAGGVAHDFNNILTGILGHITYLKAILPQAGMHVESLNAIEDGAKKASLITQQILNFSKFDSTEKASQIDLGDLVMRTCALLRGAISPEFKLKWTTPPNPMLVLGGEAKIAQVVANLVINARDAVSSGGTIEVSVELEKDEERLRHALQSVDQSATQYVCLRVRDDGSGMSPEILARIFEPYFSTKRENGTGLGLSTVREIVRMLGGAVLMESAIGKGTTASVFLPVIGMPARELAEPGTSRRLEGSTGEGERVLVIDDEYPVRNVLYLSLEHLGYSVDLASSGAEAIDKFSHPANQFDLVILDMLMPQMSGEEVFLKLRALRPGTKVILISGYCSEDSVRRVMEQGGMDFIQKPFTIGDLSRKVRECLDRSGSRDPASGTELG